MRKFRQSAIKEWKACRRQAMLDYFMDGLGYEKARDPGAPASGGRDVGSIVDLGYETYYNGGDPLAAIDAYRTATEEEIGESLSDEWEKAFRLSRIMVEGYVDWVAESGIDIGETTLATKMQLEVCVGTIRGEEVYVTGELDRLVRDDITGELIIDDCKTVDGFADLRWLAMGDQLLTYNILVRMTQGESVYRGRHTQLRKVLRSARATPPFYDRTEFPYNDTQVGNHWTHLLATLDSMVEAAQAIEADPEAHHRYCYPNPTKDCTWRCDFLAICPMLDDGSYWRNSLGDMYLPRTAKETTCSD